MSGASPTIEPAPPPAPPAPRCPNCEAPTAGAFCSACGQASSPAALNLRNLWSTTDAPRGMRHPVLRTALELLYRPGHVAAAYVEGRRRSYAHPVSYCLLTAGMCFIALKLFRPDAARLETVGSDFDRAFQTIVYLTFDYMGPITVATLPLLAAALHLFFRKTGRSLAESLVLSLYVYGQAFMVQLALAALTILSDGWQQIVDLLVPFVLLTIAAPQFYPTQSTVRTVVLANVAHILYIVAFCALLIIAAAVLVQFPQSAPP